MFAWLKRLFSRKPKKLPPYVAPPTPHDIGGVGYDDRYGYTTKAQPRKMKDKDIKGMLDFSAKVGKMLEGAKAPSPHRLLTSVQIVAHYDDGTTEQTWLGLQ